MDASQEPSSKKKNVESWIFSLKDSVYTFAGKNHHLPALAGQAKAMLPLADLEDMEAYSDFVIEFVPHFLNQNPFANNLPVAFGCMNIKEEDSKKEESGNDTKAQEKIDTATENEAKELPKNSTKANATQDSTPSPAKTPKSHSKEYHVIRGNLATGACYSEYFRSLFQSQFREQETARMELHVPITIPHCSSHEFELVLKFLNRGLHPTELPKTINKIVDLYLLADYLEIAQLKLYLDRYIAFSLNKDNWSTYYAELSGFDRVSMLCQHYFINNAQHLSLESIHLVDAPFWDAVTKDQHLRVKPSFSLLFSEYAKMQSQDPGDPFVLLFVRMTNPDVMPNIDPKAVYELLESERALIKLGSKKKQTTLQARCEDVLMKVPWGNFFDMVDRLPNDSRISTNVMRRKHQEQFQTFQSTGTTTASSFSHFGGARTQRPPSFTFG